MINWNISNGRNKNNLVEVEIGRVENWQAEHRCVIVNSCMGWRNLCLLLAREPKYTCCAWAGGTYYASFPDFCDNHHSFMFYLLCLLVERS
jgi:hypothetical protein